MAATSESGINRRVARARGVIGLTGVVELVVGKCEDDNKGVPYGWGKQL